MKPVGCVDEAVRKRLWSEEFVWFFNCDEELDARFPVAWLRPEDKRLFGCSADFLWLSQVSVIEHKRRHPEVSVDDYRIIPDIVRHAHVWAGHAQRRYLLLWLGGKPYRAAIKTDARNGDAWFLSLVISSKQKPPKGAVRVR